MAELPGDARPADAWIELPSDAKMRALRDAGMKPLYNFGFIGAMGRLLAAHPRIGPAFMELFRQVMLEPGALDRQEREMLAAVSAVAQDCHY